MQTLETLKRKIRSANELHSVVRTMKALAAVNIRQYEKAVESLEDYNRTTLLALQVVLRDRVERGSASTGGEERAQLGAVVFGSDQGMCGQLNEQIARHTLRSMDELGVGRDRRTILVVGERVGSRLRFDGEPVEDILPVPGSIGGVTPAVQDLLLRIQAWDAERNIRQVVLYYSEQLSGASYRPQSLRLLPVDAEWLARLEHRQWPTHVLPTFTMEWGALFSALIRQYLFVSLYRAFAESLASENASRLASMQGAERNIEDRLQQLTGQFHQQRQASITEELLDIVSGFEALQGSS
ncbi:MAG: F0F1 ATP synthase subunit gamma [Candidatus Brocadiia bacterium]